MVGGLRPPVAEEEEAATAAQEKGGVYFILEDADLQVGKVGKVCLHFLIEKGMQRRSGPFATLLTV
jgi:hypothetical protein